MFDQLFSEEKPGVLRFGGARMAFFDVEAGFWGLRRQLEALAGPRLADAAFQQAGANGGASFARSFVPDVTAETAAAAFRDCLAAYQAAGFGHFEIESMEWPIGRILVRGSDTFEAWMLRQHKQQVDHSACAYTAGVLVGFVNALTERQDIVCVKRHCQAQGADNCLFELLPVAEAGETAVVAYDPDPFLSRQLNLLDLLFDQMPMGIAILDRDFRIRRLNPTLIDFVRSYSPLSPSQVVPGISFLSLLPGNEAAAQAVFERVLAGETVPQESFPLQMNGVVSYWDSVSAPLRERDEVVGIVHVSTNATERELAKRQLHETLDTLQRSRERLALALRGTTDGIWDWNLQTNEVYFSPRWKSMLGYSEDDLENVFDTWQQLIHPQDRPQALAVLQKHLDGELETYTLEHRLRHKDGSYRWILTRGAALRDENGRPYRMAGSHTDITQRRKAEERLQQRIAFEKIITTISSNFINMPLHEIDQGIYQALKTIGAFTDADRAYIFLYAADGRTMSCIQEWCANGIEPQIQRLQNLSTEALAWSSRQLQQRQPLHIPRVADLPPEAAAEKEEFQSQDIQSLLTVPLSYQEKVVGFLGFDAVRREKTWTAANISLLKIVGEIFVNALEHKRSREELQAAYHSLEQRVEARTRELQRRADEVQTLFSVQQAIGSRLETNAVLQMIADEARRLTQTEMAAVYLLHGDELEIRVISGAVDPKMIGFRLPVAESIAGMVVREKRPFLVPDSDRERRVHRDLVQRVGAKSFVIVPLLSGAEPIGTITVANKRGAALDDDDRRILTMLASGAVIALENARSYERELLRRQEAERRRQVAEGLRDILARLNSDQSLPNLLQAIVDQADTLLQSDAVALYLLQEETGVLKIHAMRGEIPPEMQQVTLTVGMGTIGRVVAQRQTMVVPDVSRLTISDQREEALAAVQAVFVDAQRQEALAAAVRRFQAVLALPLTAQNVAYGGLAFYYGRPRPFSDEEVSLATAFADQAALAIQNARLRDSAEQIAVAAERNRLARELHDAVTQTLFSASLIADVLPRLWEVNEEMGRQRLAELRELTRGALAEMRTLLLELRPATLTESSLSELLQQLTTAVTGRSRLPLQLSIEGERPLQPDVQVALYRIAQEALNNILKHAGATEAALSLHFDAAAVTLTVADNGRGFDAAAVGVQSLGLGIMRERAEKIGADLQIESRVGEGTAVRVRVAGV